MKIYVGDDAEYVVAVQSGGGESSAFLIDLGCERFGETAFDTSERRPKRDSFRALIGGRPLVQSLTPRPVPHSGRRCHDDVLCSSFVVRVRLLW